MNASATLLEAAKAAAHNAYEAEATLDAFAVYTKAEAAWTAYCTASPNASTNLLEAKLYVSSFSSFYASLATQRHFEKRELEQE